MPTKVPGKGHRADGFTKALNGDTFRVFAAGNLGLDVSDFVAPGPTRAAGGSCRNEGYGGGSLPALGTRAEVATPATEARGRAAEATHTPGVGTPVPETEDRWRSRLVRLGRTTTAARSPLPSPPLLCSTLWAAEAAHATEVDVPEPDAEGAPEAGVLLVPDAEHAVRVLLVPDA